MQDVSDSITKINPLSQLLVVRGDPVLLLPELFKRWKISHIVFEKDVNGYARSRDKQVAEIAKEAGVEVMAVHGHHLYDIEEAVKRHEGKPIASLSTFEKVASGMSPPARPLDRPKELPPPTMPGKSRPKDLNSALREIHESLHGIPTYHSKPGPPKIDYNSAELGGQRKADGKVTCYDTVNGPDPPSKSEEYFTVPTLASLGMDPKSCGAIEEPVVKGGETEALRRLERLCKEQKEYLATFAKPKTSPSVDTSEPSTTLLSPFIKFGCISIRQLHYDTKDAIKEHKGPKSSPPENLEGQLLFREMYACAELATGDAYQVVRGNRLSRYMDWYLPTQYNKDGTPIEPRPRGDEVSEKRLEAYRAGQTGFPWIDAGIRQLRHTGWIHHLMRHSLACFLTRGQCWISWERGAEMFEEWLLDWDPNANAGNWMWLSCSAFFSQYFRVYGLASFGQKFDKSGSLIRRYCPELKDFPDKFIYAPHTAPMEVQKKAKCIIGQDYPFPILDEKEEKQICLNRMKTCYDAKLYGNSKEVFDGRAQDMLRKKHGQPDPKPPSKDQGKNSKIPDWAKAGHEATTGAGGKAGSTDKSISTALKKEDPEATDKNETNGVTKKRKENNGNGDEGKKKTSKRSKK
jgi:cryptochrome